MRGMAILPHGLEEERGMIDFSICLIALLLFIMFALGDVFVSLLFILLLVMFAFGAGD